jgi:branched-chain amino acid transport system permease protein
MDLSALLFQLLNGLASASSLFLVAAGLSLIFGVSRIVNFAHGSLYMLGTYIAYSVAQKFGNAYGFWIAIPVATVAVAALGTVIELIVLRRIYRAPELFQLLATFALVLFIKDAALAIWGPEDLLGPRAPGLTGSVEILQRQFPTYDLFLIITGPLVLLLLWLVLTKTRWGVLIRAATQDREMVSALGINQSWLFTSVFALGAALAGLGGALQLPREPANLATDLNIIGDAFVVVVVGGMGSIPGAFVAALIIAEIKAICIGLGTIQIAGISIAMPKLTLVSEFIVMAAVLVFKPWGLFGKPLSGTEHAGPIETPLRKASSVERIGWALLLLGLIVMPSISSNAEYRVILAIDLLTATLFAASLHFMMGPGGMHSFGHAAYFGLGAYGAALLLQTAHLPMLLSLFLAPLVPTLAAAAYGWQLVRLSGVYLAMLTLAFAQIIWSVVFQWDELTGGSNGLTGIWPNEWLSDKHHFYWFALAVVTLSLIALRHIVHSPFGFALRASRDSSIRALAIGIPVANVQWLGFVLSALFAGLSGALFAFSKGSISPDALGIPKSVDGLVMVLLGGVQTMIGPLLGAVSFTWLQDTIARNTDYWRAVLGAVILIVVMIFPNGLASLPQFFSSRLLNKNKVTHE